MSGIQTSPRVPPHFATPAGPAAPPTAPRATSASSTPTDAVETGGLRPLDPPVQRERLTQLFLRLTQIPGPTRQERKIADAIKAEVADIGFDGASIREDDAGRKIGGNAGNVIVDIPGNVPNAPPIIFCSHMDTVPLAVGCKPRLGADGIIRTDGTTALGGDNRAGCAEILEAMREIKESNLPHGPIQLVFTVAEEGGLLGSARLNPADLHGKYAFVMDVFKANQVYLQDGHLLGVPGDKPHDHTDRVASPPYPTPPSDIKLTDAEKEILGFTATAMSNAGLTPEYYRLEWGGTDAIALRRHGVNAMSLGAGENNVHTRQETMAVSDMVASTTVVRSLVDLAARAGNAALARGAAAAAVPGPVGALLATV